MGLYVRLIVFAFVPFCLSACVTTGTNFPMERVQSIELGKTTKQELIGQLGKPEREQVFTPKKDLVGKDIDSTMIMQVLSYAFSDGGSNDRILPGVTPGRWATIYLVDDIVVGYYAGSSFKADSSDFDTGKAGSIQKNKTTERDVIALFGSPSGRGIYPLASSRTGRSLFYNVVMRNSPPGSITRKDLGVQINAIGVVEDFSVNSKIESMPVVHSPTPIYIYVPTRTR